VLQLSIILSWLENCGSQNVVMLSNNWHYFQPCCCNSSLVLECCSIFACSRYPQCIVAIAKLCLSYSGIMSRQWTLDRAVLALRYHGDQSILGYISHGSSRKITRSEGAKWDWDGVKWQMFLHMATRLSEMVQIRPELVLHVFTNGAFHSNNTPFWLVPKL